MKLPAGKPPVLYISHSPDLPERAADWFFDELHHRLDQPLGRIDLPLKVKQTAFSAHLENAFQFADALVLVIGPDWQKKRWTTAFKTQLKAANRNRLPVVLLLVEGAQLPEKVQVELRQLLRATHLSILEEKPDLSIQVTLDEMAGRLSEALTEPMTAGDAELQVNAENVRGRLTRRNVGEISELLNTRVRILDPEQPSRAAKGGERAEPEEDLAQFSAFHPRAAPAGKWLKLLVYVHAEEAKYKVAEDAAEELADAPEKYALGEGAAQHGIRKGTAIRIVPQMRGFRFDPLETTVKWQDDYNRATFRMLADPKAPGFKVGVAVNGRVTFLVGPVIVGVAEISTEILAEGAAASGGQAHSAIPMYPKVFVSYSHKDKVIVEQLEQAYKGLGIEYLRDVNFLRSGEKWNPALLAKIDEANLFQLCWSANSKASKYVEQEWRHALGKGRPNFIRPTYWEKPMPAPPDELADLEFTPIKVGTG